MTRVTANTFLSRQRRSNLPQAIDDTKFKDRLTFDVSQPTNPATGIPTKSIPHMEYPLIVYKHPKEPFKKVLHRNAQHEVVHEEIVPTEHLTKTVNDENELKAALSQGWGRKPYIPQAPPDPDAHLYEDVTEESEKASRRSR